MWWHTVTQGGEVKGKLANGVGGQYSSATSEHGVSITTTADAHTSVASSRLNWHPRRFKWTRPFRLKTKSGFCACAITFQTQSTKNVWLQHCGECYLHSSPMMGIVIVLRGQKVRGQSSWRLSANSRFGIVLFCWRLRRCHVVPHSDSKC